MNRLKNRLEMQTENVDWKHRLKMWTGNQTGNVA